MSTWWVVGNPETDHERALSLRSRLQGTNVLGARFLSSLRIADALRFGEAVNTYFPEMPRKENGAIRNSLGRHNKHQDPVRFQPSRYACSRKSFSMRWDFSSPISKSYGGFK